MKKKVNVVFGVTGQIGSYLSEYLLDKGEQVVGVTRRLSTPNHGRIHHLFSHKDFSICMGDITDPFSLSKIFNTLKDKDVEYVVYNLAAMSQVHISFDQPILSAEVTGLGHVHILNQVLQKKNEGFNVKCFYMCSSEIMGSQVNINGMQDFETKFMPNSPYAAAKLYGYHMNRIYRESYSMPATSAIIFNTESPRRGEEFVTRKITKWFAKFLTGKTNEKLQLGNILACRDWTHAKDTVRAIYMIANRDVPKDYVVASGETHTIKGFIDECYKCSEEILGTPLTIACEDLYEIDEKWFRPNEVRYLRGNASELHKDFGWKPMINFKQLVKEMMVADYSYELGVSNETQNKI